MTTRRNFLKKSALSTGVIAMPSVMFAHSFSIDQPKRFIFIRKSNGIRPTEVTPLTFSENEKNLDKKHNLFSDSNIILFSAKFIQKFRAKYC